MEEKIAILITILATKTDMDKNQLIKTATALASVSIRPYPELLMAFVMNFLNLYGVIEKDEMFMPDAVDGVYDEIKDFAEKVNADQGRILRLSQDLLRLIEKTKELEDEDKKTSLN